MSKTLINTGAVLLVGAIAMGALIPALRDTQDPGRDQIQDIQAFQRERERRNLRSERPLVFLNGVFCGAGLACIIAGVALRRRSGGSGQSVPVNCPGDPGEQPNNNKPKTTLLQSLLLVVGGSCLALSVQEYFLGRRIPVSAVAGALVFLLAAVVLALRTEPVKEAGQTPKRANLTQRLLFGVVASGGLALVVFFPLVIVVRTEGHLIAGWFNEPVPWGILLGLLNVWAIFAGLFFLGYIIYVVLTLKDYNVKQST